jgi:hypothetical protein
VRHCSKSMYLSVGVYIAQVGNYVHNMATFVGGLTIGFISCWPIALLTLSTAPLILTAGCVSNGFLTRLAEHVQETYSEAAVIAEQVYHFTYSFIFGLQSSSVPLSLLIFFWFCVAVFRHTDDCFCLNPVLEFQLLSWPVLSICHTLL